VDVRFRDANGMIIIAFEVDWCGEFYPIIWDVLVERRTDKSRYGIL
jgi:hypothetical protein